MDAVLSTERTQSQPSLEGFSSGPHLCYNVVEYPCHSVGDLASYETDVMSHPLILNPAEELERTGGIVLGDEEKLLDAIIIAHIGIARELAPLDRRFITMAIKNLMEAKELIKGGRAARIAINDIFNFYRSMMKDAEEGDPVLDLPGHRNACFIAHDNLFLNLEPEKLNSLVDEIDPERLKMPLKMIQELSRKESLVVDEITNIAFSNFIEAKHSGIPVMVFSARSLPIWVVPYLGTENISSIVLPSEEYTRLGHFVCYANTYRIPIAVISESESKSVAKAAASMVAEGITREGERVAKALLHPGPYGTVIIVGGRALSLYCYLEENKVERTWIDYESEVNNLDGEKRNISLEVDSVRNLEAVQYSNIEIGLVKTEFLLASERHSGDPEYIYDFTEERLVEIYERYLNLSVKKPLDVSEIDTSEKRRVTFRLVDESGENSQDVKIEIPEEVRQAFRERQIRALVKVALKLHREIGIMIPNFESVEQIDNIYEIAEEVAEQVAKEQFLEEPEDVTDLITVVPMIESTKAIKVIGNVLKESDKVKEVALGIGDFTSNVVGVSSRDDPILVYPGAPILYAIQNAADACNGVRFTVCGDRTADRKILLLLEAAGVPNVCTATSNYTSVKKTIEGISGEMARELSSKLSLCLKMGRNPKEVYTELFANKG